MLALHLASQRAAGLGTAGMLVVASLVHGVLERPLVPRLRGVLPALLMPKAAVRRA